MILYRSHSLLSESEWRTNEYKTALSSDSLSTFNIVSVHVDRWCSRRCRSGTEPGAAWGAASRRTRSTSSSPGFHQFSSVFIFQRVTEQIITTITMSNHNSRTPGTNLWPLEEESARAPCPLILHIYGLLLVLVSWYLHGNSEHVVHMWKKTGLYKHCDYFRSKQML